MKGGKVVLNGYPIFQLGAKIDLSKDQLYVDGKPFIVPLVDLSSSSLNPPSSAETSSISATPPSMLTSSSSASPTLGLQA